MQLGPIEISHVYREMKQSSERQHGRGMLSLQGGAITGALVHELVSAGVDRSAIQMEAKASDTATYRAQSHKWDLVLVEMEYLQSLWIGRDLATWATSIIGSTTLSLQQRT